MSDMLRRVVMMMGKVTPPTYATWNPSDKHANVTLSGGNLTAVSSGATSVRSTIGKSSGKWYWEVVLNNTDNCVIGIATAASSLATTAGETATSWGYKEAGPIRNNASTLATGASFNSTIRIGVALDLDGLTVEFFKSNVSQGSYAIASGTYYAMVGSFASTTANFGATALTYSPPTGFNAGLYT